MSVGPEQIFTFIGGKEGDEVWCNWEGEVDNKIGSFDDKDSDLGP